MKLSTRERSGFTLIELLVVIAIIGVLAGLSAAALFRLKAASTETRTNETLEKLQRAYDLQYKAAIDVIRKEQPPPGLIALANNDVDMAKAVHMKLRLRREFPQNLSDVDDTGVTGDASTNATLKSLYPPKKVYTDVSSGISGLTKDKQNAVLFMVAMSQSRGGASFNPEQIGAGAISTLQGTSFKIFIDGYGNPIYYIRALSTPVSGDTYTPVLLAELNGPPYTTSALVTAKKADAIDPTGKLSQSWASTPAMATFVQNMRSYMNEPLDGTNRGPFVFSGGLDKTPFTPDDLYSFRLQSTGKAN